jgi:hypothetical protein
MLLLKIENEILEVFINLISNRITLSKSLEHDFFTPLPIQYRHEEDPIFKRPHTP